MQVDALQHGLVVVAEVHVTELDFATRRLQRDRRLGFDDTRLGRQHLSDALHRRQALLRHAQGPAEADQRSGEDGQVGVELHELAQRQAALDYVLAAEPEDDGEREAADENHERPERAHVHGPRHVRRMSSRLSMANLSTSDRSCA